MTACPVCATECPDGFRFCGGCGAPLAAREALGEERRVVTVLFADLVGFTARAEQLDPEDVRALLVPYHAAAREQIEAYGGIVEKFIGDAVVGVFGAPVAHGDDPERAVRAGLAIVARRGELDVRVGINTGETIAALDARPAEGEGIVAGDVVNTAARLQAAAPVNAILVGEQTYRCTAGAVVYDAVAPLVLKGKEQPVPAWQVGSASQAPGERAASSVPMVGRDPELAALLDDWDGVVARRHARRVTITGQAGVGKSRLVSEFAAQLRERGARVLVGRSAPYGETSAYDAFAQQIGQVVGSGTLAATVAGLVPDADLATAHLSLMLGLAAPEDAASDRDALFASARRVVHALAAERPTVLVFGDLHWADAVLLDLIDALARGDVPLLVVGVARPELEQRRPAWTMRTLEPLDESAAAELAARLLERAGQEGPAPSLGAAGEGNPLFIEELVAHVAERSAAGRPELPTSIRGIIAARLDAIPAAERALLLTASVAGRIFWEGGFEAPPAPELIAALAGRDLIRRDPRSRFPGERQYRFKHALICDVAYAALPRSRRRGAHAAVARFYERQGEQARAPAALAHHWLEAGEPQRAVDYLVAAGDLASRGWAKEEAVAMYRQALGLLSEDDGARRGRLRMRLAIAQQMLYHLCDAEQLTPGRAPVPVQPPAGPAA